MSSDYFAAGRRREARTSAAASDQAIFAAVAHLTARDRRLVRAVGEHRVLTTGQLAALAFGSAITARHRLAVLVQIGALRRFRPHREVGSAPWHYLLGPVGAALLGAEDRDENRWQTAVRADRQLALEHSQRLTHMVGANWFFGALAAHARQASTVPGLRVWLNETATTAWLAAQVPVGYHGYDMPHPDGLGVWAEHGPETTFVLEHDTGTEHLPQLTAKFQGYSRPAKAMAELGHLCPLLLFCFPTPRREQTARYALSACTEGAALRIATTATDPQQTSPAGPVWLPLLDSHRGGHLALSALDAALPDPWRHYCAGQGQARQQATQPREPPGWDEDDADDGPWRDE